MRDLIYYYGYYVIPFLFIVMNVLFVYMVVIFLRDFVFKKKHEG